MAIETITVATYWVRGGGIMALRPVPLSVKQQGGMALIDLVVTSKILKLIMTLLPAPKQEVMSQKSLPLYTPRDCQGLPTFITVVLAGLFYKAQIVI